MLVPYELLSKDILLYMRFCVVVVFFFHSPLFPSFFLYFFTVPPCCDQVRNGASPSSFQPCHFVNDVHHEQ